jgi:hypothetical protein
LTSFEWLAVAYFAFVVAAAPRAARSVRGWLYAAAAIALVIVAGLTSPAPVRAWLPHVYLVLGYWIPAAFTPAPNDDRFERWLAAADARLWCLTPTWHVSDTGRTGTAFELAYLLCYPMVPAAFTVLYLRGDVRDVERFWLAVLTAGYACYGTLRWTAARPPRLVTTRPNAGFLPALNAWVLGRVSHRLNTFPSGHVAVSVAASIAVSRVSVEAGAGFGAVAVAIAVAAVGGRYHYLVDVLLGVFLGLVAGAAAAYGFAGFRVS